MSPELFEQTLSTFRRKVPFHPFTIDLLNGVRLEIDHPDAVIVRAGKAAHIGPSGVMSIFDHEGVARVIDDLMHQSSE